jgi:predicted enzyme related to lactoylglutathione lyase
MAPSLMAVTYVFAAIPVADYAAARTWYERLMGRPPDLIPNDSEAAWQLTDTGWIYVIGDAGRAGKTLLTVLVDDLGNHVADLAARGLEVPIDTVRGVGIEALVTDPEGNTIKFAQPGG